MFPEQFSPDSIFDYQTNGSFVGDSVSTHSTEMIYEPISQRSQWYDWGFIIFFITFAISVGIVSNRFKSLVLMVDNLFRNKERDSIFYGVISDELLNKLFLCLQTILLLSIAIFRCAVHKQIFPLESLSEMFVFVGLSMILLVVYFVCKFLSYLFVGTVFFDPETSRKWINNYLSIVCLSGITLFFPVLIYFYFEQAYHFCPFVFVLYLFFIISVKIHKIYVLFFQEKGALHYFILYLCTQELIPFYLVFRGFIYLFNIVQKNTLWIQV
jgi:hypothetical protein